MERKDLRTSTTTLIPRVVGKAKDLIPKFLRDLPSSSPTEDTFIDLGAFRDYRGKELSVLWVLYEIFPQVLQLKTHLLILG